MARFEHIRLGAIGGNIMEYDGKKSNCLLSYSSQEDADTVQFMVDASNAAYEKELDHGEFDE